MHGLVFVQGQDVGVADIQMPISLYLLQFGPEKRAYATEHKKMKPCSR
jgi:hypothetical protein